MEKNSLYFDIRYIILILSFILAIFEVYKQNWFFALVALLAFIILTKTFENIVYRTFRFKLTDKLRIILVVILIGFGVLSLFQSQDNSQQQIRSVELSEKHYSQEQDIFVGESQIKIVDLKKIKRVGQVYQGRLLGDEANGIFLLINFEVKGTLPYVSILYDNKVYYEDREAKSYNSDNYNTSIGKGAIIFDIPKEATKITLKIDGIKEVAYISIDLADLPTLD